MCLGFVININRRSNTVWIVLLSTLKYTGLQSEPQIKTLEIYTVCYGSTPGRQPNFAWDKRSKVEKGRAGYREGRS